MCVPLRLHYIAPVVSQYVLALGLLFTCSQPRLAQADNRQDNHQRPNILFIAVDDLNDYISPLENHPGVRSPNLANLASQSVTFTNAHCAAPACHPSRVAVMTGVHPYRSGIYRNLFGAHGPRWRDESPTLKDAVVISQHFRNHGYTAVGGGKLFHTLQWTPGDSQNDPTAWDDYRGDPLDPISSDWLRPNLVPDEELGLTPGRPLGGASKLFGAQPLLVPNEKTGDHLLVDWALEQLKTKKETPLFLAVGLFRPHIPWEVPQEWFEQHPLDSVQLPEHREDDLDDAWDHRRRDWHRWVVENNQWRQMMRGYLASISYVDHQIGRLLEGLASSPYADNTIVVLWSDHGFHIGEKENWEKFTLWNQATRVPLFIKIPGNIHNGQATHQPVSLVDLYPTLCDLAELPIPTQCTGESLADLLTAPGTVTHAPVLTSFAWDNEPSHAITTDRYRLIHYHTGFEELYDLRTDPNEFNNLAADPSFQETRLRLASRLPTMAAPDRGVPKDSPFQLSKASATNSPQPNISKQPIGIRLRAKGNAHSPGVLLSHGGEFNGYVLYLEEQSLVFAVRRKNQIHRIRTDVDEISDSTPIEIEAALQSDGTMLLRVKGGPEAIGSAEGWLEVQPNEGLTVGADPNSKVDSEALTPPWSGQVLEIVINGERIR